MRMENGDSAIIPASRIEETDTSVIVTYMGKRTIINNAVLINVQTDKKYIKFAKLTNTKLGIIVEPIYSEKQEMPFAFSVSSKDNTKFTIEEFVDIFLDNLEVRTVISNGKYTFYRNNLIPTNWTLLSEKNLHSAYKKIQNAPVLSEKRINDKVIYDTLTEDWDFNDDDNGSWTIETEDNSYRFEMVGGKWNMIDQNGDTVEMFPPFSTLEEETENRIPAGDNGNGDAVGIAIDGTEKPSESLDNTDGKVTADSTEQADKGDSERSGSNTLSIVVGGVAVAVIGVVGVVVYKKRK